MRGPGEGRAGTGQEAAGVVAPLTWWESVSHLCAHTRGAREGHWGRQRPPGTNGRVNFSQTWGTYKSREQKGFDASVWGCLTSQHGIRRSCLLTQCLLAAGDRPRSCCRAQAPGRSCDQQLADSRSAGVLLL